MTDFISPDKCNLEQCKEMMNFFAGITGCTETVIKYTERFYEILDFNFQFMSRGGKSWQAETAANQDQDTGIIVKVS